MGTLASVRIWLPWKAWETLQGKETPGRVRLTCSKEEVPRLIITLWIKLWSAILNWSSRKASVGCAVLVFIECRNCTLKHFTLLNKSNFDFRERRMFTDVKVSATQQADWICLPGVFDSFLPLLCATDAPFVCRVRDLTTVFCESCTPAVHLNCAIAWRGTIRAGRN